MIYEANYKGEIARYTKDEFRKVPGFKPGTAIKLIIKDREVADGHQVGKRGFVITNPGFLTNTKKRLIQKALFMEADND